MNGREIIENADVVIRDDRIVAVGPAGSSPSPANARVIDVTGKTIVPGFIDALKMYMAGNRQQRQWIVMAAKELGLMPTTEGGIEHSLPIDPIFEDVVKLFVSSGTTLGRKPEAVVDPVRRHVQA